MIFLIFSYNNLFASQYGKYLSWSYARQAGDVVNLKNLFPFIAALGVFLLANNSEMQKKMNQNYSADNAIKTIPVEGFKPNE